MSKKEAKAAEETAKEKAERLRREAFGRRARALRKDLGLTQEYVAKKIGAEQPKDVWRYETGKTLPGAARLERLANVLGTTTAYLMSGKASSGPTAEPAAPDDDAARRGYIAQWAAMRDPPVPETRVRKLMDARFYDPVTPRVLEGALQAIEDAERGGQLEPEIVPPTPRGGRKKLTRKKKA